MVYKTSLRVQNNLDKTVYRIDTDWTISLLGCEQCKYYYGTKCLLERYVSQFSSSHVFTLC
jgi:hypothetical protein